MVLYKFLNSPSIVLLQYFNSFSVIDKIVDIDTILVLLNLNTMITNQLTNRPGSRDAIASKKHMEISKSGGMGSGVWRVSIP